MKKSDLLTTQNEYVKDDSKDLDKTGGNTFVNCGIANDAPKKIDFLLLVIETLQINATDSLFLKANNIGLSDEFTSRVQFWKIRCYKPLRKSYTFSSLSSEQND